MAAAGRGQRCRGVVVLLLLASVLAPLALYGTSPVSLPDSTGTALFSVRVPGYLVCGNAGEIRA
jgi:hypothetical protein